MVMSFSDTGSMGLNIQLEPGVVLGRRETYPEIIKSIIYLFMYNIS